ncbi:MAG: transcriptional regulator [Verrucomicrobia bacterium]|nr:MAG: transcriptional regulator [Verrucomicrobiota bacterium]
MDMRGFDNESLAAATGKHYNSVLRLKREQSTTLSDLEKLCEVLRCHPFDLIVAEGFPEPFLVAPASR